MLKKATLILALATGLVSMTAALAVAVPAQTPVVGPAQTPVVAPAEVSGDDVPTATGASLVGSPVANLVADFAKAETVKGRPVQLQELYGATWTELARAKLDSAGRADFRRTTADTGTYRAVAPRYQYKKKVKGKKKSITLPAVATPNLDLAWGLLRDYTFDGSGQDGEWRPRNVDSFKTGGRQCSAVRADNSTISGGLATLRVSAESVKENIAAARAAGCTKNVYRNATISTLGTFTVGTGAVASLVKFPKARGMHGSVWLLGGDGTEIDIIETYGVGRNITQIAHVNKRQLIAYKTKKKTAAWYDSYHVFSVEWTRGKMTFRTDGAVTGTLNVATSETEYFLNLSLLSSDWEQHQIDRSKLPASMAVEWVRVWSPTR